MKLIYLILLLVKIVIAVVAIPLGFMWGSLCMGLGTGIELAEKRWSEK